MSRDEIEFLISQYIDGSANELDAGRLEEVLATDADARAMLAEYRRLDEVVKTSAPMPDIAWDDLAAKISSATANLDVPVKHYRLAFGTFSRIAAMAAMVAIVVGVVVHFRPSNSSLDIRTSGVAVSHLPIDVQISAPTAMASAPVSEIQVGQPAGFAAADFHSSDAVVSSPTSIWIASGDGSAQDNEPSLY
jgi:hypothetical protein